MHHNIRNSAATDHFLFHPSITKCQEERWFCWFFLKQEEQFKQAEAILQVITLYSWIYVTIFPKTFKGLPSTSVSEHLPHIKQLSTAGITQPYFIES